MFKKVLKWFGIGVVALLVLLLIVSGIIYVAFPTFTVSVTRDVSVSPDEAFAAFADFSQWDNYFEYDELFPPEGELAMGTRFGYRASEGDMALEVIEYVPGEVVRFDMQSDTVDAMFSLNLEPIEGGTRVTASNEFSSTGILRVMIVLYSLTGEVEAYYGNMLENVERVALEKSE